MKGNFILFQTILFVGQFIIVYLIGWTVKQYNIRINYSRKILHFVVIFTPYLLEIIIPYEKNMYTVTAMALVAVFNLILFAKPLRMRSEVLKTMFLAIDRPEDRPYTLLWFVTQYIAGAIILVPMFLGFIAIQAKELVFIPIIINGIGDGLAEPIGVWLGKHPYKTKAIFVKREYIRTLEGSLTVFVCSVVTLIFFRDSFTLVQYLITLLILPIAVTITEAKSPHTWDSPLIFLICGICLLLIKLI